MSVSDRKCECGYVQTVYDGHGKYECDECGVENSTAEIYCPKCEKRTTDYYHAWLGFVTKCGTCNSRVNA